MNEHRFAPVEAVGLLATDPSGMDRDELCRFLRTAARHKAWVERRESLAIRALDALPKDPSSPAKDTAGDLARQQNLGQGEAKRKTETAKQLSKLPGTDAALGDGAISPAHAEAMARARSKADPTARAALEAHEAELLAEGAGETAWEFGRRLERFVKEHSADDGRSTFDKQRAARRLAIWRDKDGMTQLRGAFDPVTGQAIRSTIDRVSEQLWRRDHQEQPIPAEERSNEQRAADALAEVCKRADQVDGVAKNLDRAVVFLSYETLLDLLDTAGIDTSLADGSPISASVARRLACDAGLIPVVLGGDSVPLDEGRAKRVATPAQRLGLACQWETCAVGDCTVPFDWAQIHHIDPFAERGRQGRTDLGNLLPACDHCHDLAHTPGWTVEKLTDGSVITTAPDGTTWHREPNGPATRRRRAGPPPAAATEHRGSAPLFTKVA